MRMGITISAVCVQTHAFKKCSEMGVSTVLGKQLIASLVYTVNSVIYA